MNEAELPPLEQDTTIGRRETTTGMGTVGNHLADCELAGQRLALRFEVDADCETLELAAACFGSAELFDERRKVAGRLEDLCRRCFRIGVDALGT